MLTGLVHPRVPRAVVPFLLLVHACLLAYSAAWHSPTNDEVAHLSAGISHWHFGRFELYRVNPPLVRMLAALPVVLARPVTDWSHLHGEVRPDWRVGRDFIAANGEQSFWYFTLARWACIPLSLVGGYICFRWASDLYGRLAGILALTLWCFCPNILAHAQIITPDAGATALGVAAAYFFWRWLKQPTWSRALVAGVALGLAELTKTTWIVLFLLWPLLWIVWKWLEPRAGLRGSWFWQAVQLCSISLLALSMINLGYGFEGSFHRLKHFGFLAQTFNGDENDRTRFEILAPGNRFRDSWLGLIPVPVPSNYLLGIDLQKWEFEQKWPSYLRGEWQLGGWWYYYLYALAIKVPLGTWVLILLAVFLRVCRFGVAAPWQDELVLLAPFGVVLSFVSSQTGFSHHMRYVLPILPFAFIWLGQLACVFSLQSWKLPALVATALAWSVGSGLSVYPHNLSYFNELVGGPSGGHAHLNYSNIDWGQDLLYLKRWLKQHPEAGPLRLAYFGHVNPAIAGIEFTLPPAGPLSSEHAPTIESDPVGPQPGWYAVSVNLLRDQSRVYTYFLQFRPLVMAGYSIYIYHIKLEEANRVRKELGLKPLDGAIGTSP